MLVDAKLIRKQGSEARLNEKRHDCCAPVDALAVIPSASRDQILPPTAHTKCDRPAIADLYDVPITREWNGQVLGLFPECAAA